MIGIIEYNAGNIQSICNALSALGQDFRIITKPQELKRVTKVIFPGVGAAGSAMQSLLENNFIEAIPRLQMPFLGICIGMQLLADFSEEGGVQCLGIIPGKVKKIPAELKIPHIGWNKVRFAASSPLTRTLNDSNRNFFYFVNSYYFDAPEQYVIGKTPYGISFPSMVQKENFFGIQFHAEKSGTNGMALLRNFCEQC